MWANPRADLSGFHSALPIALVILTLCAFLTWQGYHWWHGFAHHATNVMAGPWG